MSASTTPVDLPRIVLECRKLSVAFTTDGARAQVTHDVDLVLHQGETLALVGESGSGKSVTAMSIPGLLPGTADVSGEILFEGEDLLKVGAARLDQVRGAQIGVVFQEPMTALNPVYNVGQLLAEALTSHGKVPSEEIRARSIELLRLVGMPDPARRLRYYPHELSGGQRQRAMIALAISGNPQVLIADEPTTALDVTVQAEILALLRSLQRQLGMAMLFITHDMGVVAEVADRVSVMKDGRVVEHAEVHQLFANPTDPYTQKLLAAVPVLDLDAVEDVYLSEPEPADVELEVVNLEVRYGGGFRRSGTLAVDDVTFRVPRGQMVGLVGESGSGKSTIGKSVVGLVKPTGGQLLFDGVDLAKTSARERARVRSKISMVFQDPASSLNPRATIGSTVVDPLIRHGVIRAGREARLKAGELLEQVSLPPDWIERYPHELSGGQRQRVGIARAIAMRPRLMIADEPTSALDVSVQAGVLDLLRDLQDELGFSCLFITHDLALVDLLTDWVVVLQQGQIVEQGTPDRILRSPVEEYTKRLVSAAPVPDPVVQKERARNRVSSW